MHVCVSSQAGPSRQRQQQRRGDLKCLAGMISPRRLITYITAAACSAVCQRARVCLFLIVLPACVSIRECPRFTSTPREACAPGCADGGGAGPREGPGRGAVRPLRGGVRGSRLPPVASRRISQLDGNRESPRSPPLGGPETSTTVPGSFVSRPSIGIRPEKPLRVARNSWKTVASKPT